MDQNGCIYQPHACSCCRPVRLEGTELGRRSTTCTRCRRQTHSSTCEPPNRKERSTRSTRPEDPFQVEVDVHPWMTAYTM